MTASQPQLQVMLLDGAIQAARRAQQLCREADQWTQAESQLAKAADIVAALVQGAAAGKAQVSKQLEEEYAFLFRELASARINRDLAKVDAALGLLEYERETWKMAAEKVVDEADASTARGEPRRSEPRSDPPNSTPTAAPEWDASTGGFSIEA